MSSVWAEYCVSHVRYDEEGTRITHLNVHQTSVFNLFFSCGEQSRETVIAAIEAGHSFVTVTIDANGHFELGENIHVVPSENPEYLRTDADHELKDNLGSLPSF